MSKNQLVPPLVYSPNDAAIRLAIPLRAVYSLISAGQLRSYKDGKRRLIPDTELLRHVQQKMAEENI